MEFSEELKAKVDYEFSHRYNHTLHAYIDIANDLIAGTLLSQIMYWFSDDKCGNRKVRVYKDGYYWLAKSRTDWVDEIRISPKQYDNAVKKLKERGLVETKLYKFNAVPTVHIRPIYEEINKKVEQWKCSVAEEISCMHKNIVLNLPNGKNGFSPNGKNEFAQTVNSITETTNKDYNTENTKMYTSPSKEDEGVNVYLSSEERRIEKPYCPNTGYTNEQLRDYIKAKIPMLVKQRGGLNVGTQEDLIDIILYFYQEYNRRNPAQHPVLSNATFSDIIQKYECPPETMCEYGAYGFADYKEVIDKYFETDFGRQKKSEYGNTKPITRLLPHFMCDNIREYLYRRVTGL